MKVVIPLIGVLFFGICIGLGIAQSRYKPNDKRIQWLGCPIVGSPFGQAGVFTNAEYGLREDGVIVWRKR